MIPMYGYVLLLSILVNLSDSAVPGDLVTSLPGLSTAPTFKHYSGYLKVSKHIRHKICVRCSLHMKKT